MSRGYHRTLYWRGAATAVLSVMCLASATGCAQFIGILLQGFGPPKHKKQHELAERKTLVLVDDPKLLLGGTDLAWRIGDEVAINLVRAKSLRQSDIVPQNQLNQLLVELGSDYAKMPVDRIGRMLEAQQVIHINIDSVRLFDDGGVFKPKAQVTVKVIDAVKSRRLFPSPPVHSGPPPKHAAPRGYQIQIEMTYHDNIDVDPGYPDLVRKRLSHRIARDVGRVFHNWKEPEPGHSIKG